MVAVAAHALNDCSNSQSNREVSVSLAKKAKIGAQNYQYCRVALKKVIMIVLGK